MKSKKHQSHLTKYKKLLNDIKKARNIYLFISLGLVFYIVFKYVPMYFIQIAFRDYRVTRPLNEAEWVGFKHFIALFNAPGFYDALANTLIINFYKLLVCFTAPIFLAIFLNEIKIKKFKRVTQTIFYLPHFISWAVIGSILTNLLSVNNGVINGLLETMGFEAIHFLGSKQYFRGIVVLSELWRDAGYSAIIFLAALTAIDPQLYEAADIDGANWIKKMWYITLAGIKDTIVVLLILRMGSMISGNFDQIFTILNPQVYAVGDTLDTFVYRMGLQNGRYGLSAAAGLFNTVVAAILLFTSDRIAKKVGERGLF